MAWRKTGPHTRAHLQSIRNWYWKLNRRRRTHSFLSARRARARQSIQLLCFKMLMCLSWGPIKRQCYCCEYVLVEIHCITITVWWTCACFVCWSTTFYWFSLLYNRHNTRSRSSLHTLGQYYSAGHCSLGFGSICTALLHRPHVALCTNWTERKRNGSTSHKLVARIVNHFNSDAVR